MSLLRLALIVLLPFLLAPAVVHAQDWRAAASPYDLERLDNALAARDKALAQALIGAKLQDLATLREILQPAQSIGGEALIGDWRCRTMKVGGLLPLTIYGWFKCQIDYGPNGLTFRKLTGSQRTSGELWPIYAENGEGFPVRWIYLGASHYGDEPPRAYGGPDNPLGKTSKNRDDPGILEAIGPNHIRIGFPSPVVESDYDFLDLRR